MKRIFLLFLLALMPFNHVKANEWKKFDVVMAAGLFCFTVWNIYQIFNGEKKNNNPNLLDQPKMQLKQETKLESKTYVDSVPTKGIDILRVYGAITPISVLQQASNIAFQNESQEGNIAKDTAVTWQVVRKQESLNCGYHALKNIIEFLDHLNDANYLNSASEEWSSLLNDKNFPVLDLKLKARERYAKTYLKEWTQIVWKNRVQNLANRISRKSCIEIKDLPKSNDLTSDQLLKIAEYIKLHKNNIASLFENPEIDAHYIANINKEDGSICISNLNSEEIIKILEMTKVSIKQKENIVVLEFDPKRTDKLVGSLMIDAIRNRIGQFKRCNTDKLGIVWTEQGLGHWIGYVAVKQNGQVALFEMNSLVGCPTRQSQYLLQFLQK